MILVDDGVATGSTIRAAIKSLRQLGLTRLVVAAPVMSPTAYAELCSEADECACCVTPEPFYAVGVWYACFDQTTDEEVRDLLARATVRTMATAGGFP